VCFHIFLFCSLQFVHASCVISGEYSSTASVIISYFCSGVRMTTQSMAANLSIRQSYIYYNVCIPLVVFRFTIINSFSLEILVSFFHSLFLLIFHQLVNSFLSSLFFCCSAPVVAPFLLYVSQSNFTVVTTSFRLNNNISQNFLFSISQRNLFNSSQLLRNNFFLQNVG